MDEEGYLPVSLIASFHRVEALTRDIKLVIQAVEHSDVVEIADGVKVRAGRASVIRRGGGGDAAHDELCGVWACSVMRDV